MKAIIEVGSRVVLQDAQGRIEEVELVRPSSPKELDWEHGQISVDSPVGRALLGHTAGEEILVSTPLGEIRYRVVEVRVADPLVPSGFKVAGGQR